MFKNRLRNTALVLSCAALLCACGPTIDTPTSVPTPQPTSTEVTATPTALSMGAGQALPNLKLPEMLLGTSSTLPTNSGPPARMEATDATLGPPSWVKPGMRITYYQAAASIAQANFEWIEDPNGPYYDPKTDKHYSRTDESSESNQLGGGAGDGFTVINILAVEGSDVVLSWGLYTINHLGNNYIPGGGGGLKVNGAEVDGLWINPQQLATMVQNPQTGGMALEGDFELDGKTYHSVSFVNQTPNNYSSNTYDLDTGLFIASSTTTIGPTNAGGAVGNTVLTISKLQGMRQRSIPALNGQNPSWVANTTKLEYDGQYNYTNPMDPANISYTYPTNNIVTLSKGGKNWSPFTNVVQVQAAGFQPIKGSGITGSAGFYWTDPAALKNLKKNQQLDKDPITGDTVTVQAVGTQNGTKVVTILTQMPGISTVATYDQTSGALLAYTSNVASTGTTVQLQLKNKP